MLNHKASILHHQNPRRRELFRHRVIPNPRLKPYNARLLRKNIRHMRRQVLRPPKHIQNINLSGHLRDSPIHFAPERLRYIRVIHEHRNNIDPRMRKIRRHTKSRLLRLFLRLHTQDRDPLRAPHNLRNPRLIRNDIGMHGIFRR